MCTEIYGVKVNVSFWFSAVFCLLLLLDKSGTAGIAVVSAILHEFGHFAAMYLTGTKPLSIKLTPFGMSITLAPVVNLSYKKEIQVALCGPLVNLVICLICYAFSSLGSIFLVNVVLFLSNMLPFVQLDGGRILMSIVAFLKGPDFAAGFMNATSIACLSCGCLLLIICTYEKVFNPSLIFFVVYLGLLFLQSRGLLVRNGN